MQNVEIALETRKIGAPQNWDVETMGECVTISVRDEPTSNGNVMTTAWRLTDDEIRALRQGGHLIIGVYGVNHPVLSLGIADKEGNYAVG